MASSSVHVGEMTGFEIQFSNIFCAFFKHLTLFDIHVYIFLISPYQIATCIM